MQFFLQGHNNINMYLVIGWHSCCVPVADWTTVMLYAMSTGNIGGKYIAVCCTDCLGISYLLQLYFSAHLEYVCYSFGTILDDCITV